MKKEPALKIIRPIVRSIKDNPLEPYRDHATLLELCHKYNVGIIQIMPKMFGQNMYWAFYEAYTPGVFDVSRDIKKEKSIYLYSNGDSPSTQHLYFFEMVMLCPDKKDVRQHIVETLNSYFKGGVTVNEPI